ncbi:MAG: O-antigen polymerase [uncultured bacterium]|nr:MAG: O-antigen polymerase [uncultured bacterium]
MINLLSVYIFTILIQIPVVGGLFQGSSVGTNLYAAIDIIFFIIVIIIYSTKFEKSISNSDTLKSIYAFIIYAFISMLWSVSLNLEYGAQLLLRDFIRVTSIAIMASNVCQNQFRKKLSKVIVFSSIAYLILSILTMSYGYDFKGSDGRLMYSGYKDANPIARDIGLLTIIYYWLFKNKDIKNNNKNLILLFLLGVAFLAVFSKTTVIAFIFAIYFSYFHRKLKVKNFIKMAMGICTLIIILIYFRGDYLTQYLTNVQGGNALSTLSGRTDIWNVAFRYLIDNFLFGHGINSFSNYSSRILNNAPAQVHNEIINIIFSYGVVGLILVSRIYLKYYNEANKSEDQSIKILIKSLVIFYLIVGFTEANIVTTIAPLWIFTLFAIYATRSTRKAERF